MTIEYNLFRTKFIRPCQASFLQDGGTPEALLVKAIEQKPSAEFRREYVWHIGNIVMFTLSAGYFAVGRTTKTTIAKYDDSSGNFMEETSQASPYTHVVFDAQLGLMAIAKKTMLAPTSRAIASIIAKLLQRTDIVIHNGINVEIDIINDPTTFIDGLHAAYELKVFSATFTGPNPYDADEHFQKPLSVYLNSAKGVGGKATIYGNDLDRDVVEAVARSTAATGNTANARVVPHQGDRAIKIDLAGNPVKLLYNEEDHDTERPPCQ